MAQETRAKTIEPCSGREDGGEHLVRYRVAGPFEQGDKDGLIYECAYCRVRAVPVEAE